MSLGLYISVPFCRTKCTYCNFASDVFSRAAFQRYVDRVCSDIMHAARTAEQMGGHFEGAVDTIYLGGGTPTVLDISHLERLFVTISQNFEVAAGAEITVECAPGTLTAAVLESFTRCGVNRVSLGIQSFVDQEARSVGRLHTRAVVLDDIARLRDAGISNINVDLIAGLPHQTAESWEFSLQEAIACGAPHVSVYMLEVDEDSRLGRELIAGGTKYHAHFVPDEDLTADLYVGAGERLEEAGIKQYEISNFGRGGFESRHNLKYWTSASYWAFGVSAAGYDGRFRWSNTRNIHEYLACVERGDSPVTDRAELTDDDRQSEALFLQLRLEGGVDMAAHRARFGVDVPARYGAELQRLREAGLVEMSDGILRISRAGTVLANEVFEVFV